MDFEGIDPISNLAFLTKFNEVCDSTGVHEGAAV